MGKNATARRMFRHQWLQDPNLKDWVAPSEKGEAFVRCKICSCDIRAHCANLTKHAETRKHRTRVAPKDQHRLRDVVAPVLAVEEEQKRCALKIAFFTACHMSITCVDELLDLLKGQLNVRLLKEMYNDEKNRAYLLFLQPVLTDLKRVNKMFQGENMDPLGIFEDLRKLYNRLLARILKPSVLRQHDEASLCDLDLVNLESIYLNVDDADFGSSFNDHINELHLASEERVLLKQRCFAFLKACASDLQKRLPNTTSLQHQEYQRRRRFANARTFKTYGIGRHKMEEDAASVGMRTKMGLQVEPARRPTLPEHPPPASGCHH
ncbi:hypothetical protein MRX96_054526 [Rhipicephalus microplus]